MLSLSPEQFLQVQPRPDGGAQIGDRLGLGIGQVALLFAHQRAGIIGIERQVEPAVATDRHHPVPAARRRAAELHPRAVGQCGTQ